jgi:hypothetical protein
MPQKMEWSSWHVQGCEFLDLDALAHFYSCYCYSHLVPPVSFPSLVAETLRAGAGVKVPLFFLVPSDSDSDSDDSDSPSALVHLFLFFPTLSAAVDACAVDAMPGPCCRAVDFGPPCISPALASVAAVPHAVHPIAHGRTLLGP